MEEPITIFAVLLAVGILLICAEVFVPGGILGAAGTVALIGAMAVSFWAFHEAAVFVSLGIVVLLGVMIALWIKLFPKSRIGKRMTLSEDAKDFEATQKGLEEFLGKEGETKSDLHPGGFAIIDGKRVDVVTEGGMIAKGVRVRVIEVEGNRVVVRQATQ